MGRQTEIWKDIPGYEGLYAGSNLGRIKSYDRITMRRMNGGGIHPQKFKGKILKQYISKSGYHFVRLCQSGTLTGYYVHILLAKAFISNSDKNLVVNHKDGNKLHNNINNLEWVTRSENQFHAYEHGLQKRVNGNNHYATKIKTEEINDIKSKVASGIQQKVLAEEYNVSKALINIIVKGKHRTYA